MSAKEANEKIQASIAQAKRLKSRIARLHGKAQSGKEITRQEREGAEINFRSWLEAHKEAAQAVTAWANTNLE